MGYKNPAFGPIVRDPLRRLELRLENAKKHMEECKKRRDANVGKPHFQFDYNESQRMVREAEVALKKLRGE